MKRPRLCRLLSLETPTMASDGAGGFDKSWNELGTVWADVKVRSGGAHVNAGGVRVSRLSYEITVRSAPVGSAQRPSPDQRFREGARFFVIKAVAERDPLGRFLTCFAEEEIAA